MPHSRPREVWGIPESAKDLTSSTVRPGPSEEELAHLEAAELLIETTSMCCKRVSDVAANVGAHLGEALTVLSTQVPPLPPATPWQLILRLLWSCIGGKRIKCARSVGKS